MTSTISAGLVLASGSLSCAGNSSVFAKQGGLHGANDLVDEAGSLRIVPDQSPVVFAGVEIVVRSGS